MRHGIQTAHFTEMRLLRPCKIPHIFQISHAYKHAPFEEGRSLSVPRMLQQVQHTIDFGFQKEK